MQTLVRQNAQPELNTLWTHNQWSCWSSGIVRSDDQRELTCQVVAFSTECNQFSWSTKIPAPCKDSCSNRVCCWQLNNEYGMVVADQHTYQYQQGVLGKIMFHRANLMQCWETYSDGFDDVCPEVDVGVNVDTDITNRSDHWPATLRRH